MNRLLQPIRNYQHRRAERRHEKSVVKIEHPQMKIKGRRYRSIEVDGRYTMYYGFLGIPYAAPPIGCLRAKPPQPLRVRRFRFLQTMFVRAAKPTSLHPCVQFMHKPIGKLRKGVTIGSEDCLYLNVYLPTRPEEITELLPVLVYIHGGEFERGSNDRQAIKPQFIVEADVVFVTMNYRLGVFGFLNTGTEECQGNAGLKDQVKALEWIRDNIAKFKGNPENVTISGHEAGATSVNLHLISPLSRNLFHKAIVQAGGIHCPWGFKGKNRFVNELCQKAIRSKEQDMTEAMVNAMQHIEADDLMTKIEKLSRTYLAQRSRKFAVFVGPSEEFRAEGAFLPPCESIETLMKQASPVPVIAGITKREGYKYFYERLDWTERKFKELVTNENEFIEFLKETFHWSTESATNQKDAIKEMYFKESTNTSEPKNFRTVQENLAVFLTDVWFHHFYENFKIGNEPPFTVQPFYVYQLNYFDKCREDAWDVERGEDEEIRMITHTAPGHGEDMGCLYNPEKIQRLIRSDRKRIVDDKNTRKIMCHLWGAFCHNKELEYKNFTWLRHTEEQPRYLSIDRPLAMVPGPLGGDRWPKLRSILESVSRHPTPEPSPTPERSPTPEPLPTAESSLTAKPKPGTSIEGEFSTTSSSEPYESATDESLV